MSDERVTEDMLELCLPDPFILEVYHLEKRARKGKKNPKVQPEKQKQS